MITLYSANRIVKNAQQLRHRALYSPSRVVRYSGYGSLLDISNINQGDLGVNAPELEARLEDICHLAQSWGCVLLLDEADIFLSQRSPNDLVRNSLVSGLFKSIISKSGSMSFSTDIESSVSPHSELLLWHFILNHESGRHDR